MKTIRLFPILPILSLALTAGLQNCKKAEPDPVTPGITNPGSNTMTTTGPVLTKDPVASGVTNSSAILTGVIDGNGGEPITSHTFFVIDASNGSSIRQITLGATSGPFPLTVTQPLTGLQAGKKHTIYFVVANKKSSTQRGTEFTTATATTSTSVAISIAAQQQDILNITGSSFAMRSFLFAPQGTAVTQHGHVWTTGTNQNPTTVDRKTELGPATVGSTFLTFNSSITGLAGSTNYSVRGYAIIAGQTYYANPSWTVTTLEQTTNSAVVTKKAGFPAKVSYSPTTIYEMNGKAYVSAAAVYDDKTRNNRTDFYEYDPAIDKWTFKAAIPADFTDAGYGSVAFVHKNKWYYGFGGTPGIGAPFNYRSLWEYDPASDKWTRKYDYATRPFENSYYTSSAYLNGQVYILSEKKFTVFDVERNIFTEAAAFPITYRASDVPKLSTLDGKLYALIPDANSRLFEYDPSTGKWTERANGKAAMKFPATYFGNLMAINGKLYASSAWGAAEYNPTTNNWRKVLDNTALDLTLQSNTYIVIGNRAFLGLYNQKTDWAEFKP